MDIDKIIDDLNRRFTAPLPEYYQRRIIFWYDEDREFEDKLDELELDNAKLAVLTGSNSFAIKKLLSNDDVSSNYLVYEPQSFDRPDDDWLIDMKLYSEEFRADLISIWMDELRLPSGLAMRKQVRHYRKYFNAKERRGKLLSQTKVPENPAQLHMAVMAAICGLKDPRPNQIIRTVLSAELDQEKNTLYQELVNYEADGAFWAMVQQGTGYGEEQMSLSHLAVHLLLTAATRTMAEELLEGLEQFISIPHQTYCYDLVSEWLSDADTQRFYEIARYVEDEAHLAQRFTKLEVRDLVDTECFPCINEILLTKLMTDISDQTADSNIIRMVVEKRRTCVWYDRFENFYDGVYQVANIIDFYREHSAGFHTAIARDIWSAYTTDYYRMDTYYRLFHVCFQNSLQNSNMLLDDLFKHVVDKVEGLYRYWFLRELNDNWFHVCGDELTEYGKILEIPQQENFYRSRVQGADSRVFVVISDAMRYEVAVTLAEELRRETQSQVTLDSMESIFPSITKFGMAALLPHQKLSVEVKGDSLTVLADGLSTGSGNRNQVLKNTNENSVALQYKNIIGLKRAERSALVKGMDVVYIYHDVIDDASHHSDTAVFPACEQAITELKNLARIIVNEFGGTNILFTADHGFLFTYSPLDEDSKVDKSVPNGMDVDYGRRHVIMQAGAKPDYLLPVKFLDGNTGYEGFAPRENVRIKLKGGGMNFVHGGVSLQELVAPVIEYHFLRNDSLEYRHNRNKYDTKPVPVSLLSAGRKVSNMIFSLSFYQKEAVSANREAAAYQVYFTDDNGKTISDVQKIIADKTSDNGKERTFRRTFNLKPLKYDRTAIYYLVISDESGMQAPQREEFQIDIAFAIEDFDFLS